MESTKLLDALFELRKQHAEPVSHLEVLRGLALREIAKAHQVELPPVFNEQHRLELLSHVDHLTSFLSCDEGADAVELLMDSFRHYVIQQNKPVYEVQSAHLGSSN